jgi:hypothetical protein
LNDETELSQLKARLDVLESKQAIVELLIKYCRGVDRGDLELLKSVYHSDAIDDHNVAFSGNAHELAEFILPELTRSYPHRHAITNPLVELDGERAYCESQYTSSHRLRVDSKTVFDVEAYGRYFDIMERRDGVWRIAYRRLLIERTMTLRVSAFDLESAVLTPPWSVDPVYDRFETPETRPADHRIFGGIFDRLISNHASV